MISSEGQGLTKARRSLDAEVNLVPFIDLLSMCICFLLMTAVWIQIASLNVKQSHGTSAPDTAGQLDLSLKFSTPTSLDFVLEMNHKQSVKKTISGSNMAELSTKLEETLKTVTNVGSAMLTPGVGVSYGDLVAVMDILRRHQIVNMGIVPTGDR